MAKEELVEFEGELDEFKRLADMQFAQEWRNRYMAQRTLMLPDIARWMRLLRFFHPRTMQDHWQDQFGNALPKLFQSQGLSVEIYNWCRPIIEVYGSLLAGQKPLPFTIDVQPTDTDSESEVFRADSQEKVLLDEIYNQKIPLHFSDFCTSVVLFGIGYVYSWVDPKTRRLKTTAITWPGDVLPQWGSDRYGNGSEALESCILTERLPLDAAKRMFPDVEWTPTQPDVTMKGDVSSTLVPNMLGSVQIIKVWWRWNDERGKEKIGYAEIALDSTRDKQPAVLLREDDTKYPDIPVRWAARFPTPGQPPHQSAGVLDDIVGINTEYNEKLSALADMLLKYVYPKYKAKGFNIGSVPRMPPGSNMFPLAFNQDIEAIMEQVNQVPFDTFLTRLETMMLTIAGLSRLMMGTMPPGETSGEALNNLLHASLGRLEIVRTPIQWAWTSMIDEIWVPLLTTFYHGYTVDRLTGARKAVRLDFLFEHYKRTVWVWPDVTPKDALRAAQIAMAAGRAGYLSDESVRARLAVASPIDEQNKIRKERQDPIMHPQEVQQTATAQMTLAQLFAQAQAMQNPQQATDDAAKRNAQVQDGTRKYDAARSVPLDESDNAPQGSPDNAAQGFNNAPGGF